MATRGKKLVVAILIAFGSLVANCSVFLVSYNRLAAPFLTEERRVLNADVITTMVAGTFAVVAILTGVAIYWALDRSR